MDKVTVIYPKNDYGLKKMPNKPSTTVKDLGNKVHLHHREKNNHVHMTMTKQEFQVYINQLQLACLNLEV